MWFWRIRFLNLTKWRSALSLVSSLRKGRDPSFEQTWIPSTLGCSVPSLVEISQVLLEKKIALYRYHIPFGKGGPFIWIFVTQGYFVLGLLEIGPVFLEKIFYILFLLTLSLLSPLAKGCGPSIGEIWYPFTQGCFVTSLVEKWRIGSRRWRRKCLRLWRRSTEYCNQKLF